ncbi:MAG: serine dehydratase [Nostocales cyanobacterium]|nr:MAG: serine dehydratase [Nostocales cyanobacterium]TAF13857.1 MAG: serine dehydratase [Nostocales cyanobacterium]
MQLLNFILHQNFTLPLQPVSISSSKKTDYGNNIYTLEDLVDSLEEAAKYLQVKSS